MTTLSHRLPNFTIPQLRRSSLDGNASDVQSLLDAGVSASSETDGLVNTVAALLAGGADLKRKDDNGNTILMSAAQMCGPKIVGDLIAAGADMNLASGGGMTPLSMALLMHHPDAAEVLVAEGARLNASQVQMLSASVTDPREKSILQRAAKK